MNKHAGGRRRNPEREEAISEVMARSPTKSLRRLSAEMNVPYTSCQRIVRKYLKLYPFHLQRLQALHAEDHEACFNFVSMMCQRIEGGDGFLNNWLFTDEATFHVSGRVNTHNCIVWARQNPHISYELERSSPKVNVWCGVSRNKVYGPFFFAEKTIRHETYLDMLQLFMLPQLEQDDNMDIVFQQDGAPPHWAWDVRNFLNATFNGMWCGRGGPIAWPPNSPDLTPPDFFVWGFVKDLVYAQKPRNIDDLKLKITQAFTQITPLMLQRT